MRRTTRRVFRIVQPEASPRRLDFVRRTFRVTGRNRDGRFHGDKRPCVLRPLTITHVITRSVRLNTGTIVTTLLRSLVRSARCGVSFIRGRFNYSITCLIEIIAGRGGRRCRVAGRISGFGRVLSSIRCSVHTVLVGLTSHLRGVHALTTRDPSGRVGVTNRASYVCTPLTGQLNFC